MSTRTMLESRWTELKGRIREAWGAVNDDELQRLEGRWDQVVALIQRKTGQTVDTIEAKLDELIDELSDDDENPPTR